MKAQQILRFTRLFLPLSLSCFLLLLLAGNALAQTPGTGAIHGTVFDPSGRVVSNAKVTVANESTHASRTVFSSSTGSFIFPLLEPGSYSLAVNVEGFEEKDAHSLNVVVAETTDLEFHLAVAKAGTSIEVVADSEIAQTQSSTLGRAVDQKAIEALPLSNRNYTQILSLSPGVVVGLPDATVLGRGTQDVTALGNKTTANNIQFNGVDANNLSQNSAAADGEEVGVAVPAPDTIQEFKVQTGNYDATYGRGTGANVDVVSRTGTNQFHGTAWEFLRNDIFNANSFFAKLDGQPRPVLKQNQFGAAVGGPILRDKLFFFAGYQGLRSSNGQGNQTTVTLPQLTADRPAATLGAQFCPYQTFAGGTQVLCDGSNINPVALNLLNFKLANGQYAIPSPQINLPSTDPTQLPVGQSTYSIPATYREDQFTANIDQVLTQKDQLSARFFYSHAPTIEPFSPNAANVPGWGTNELDQNAMLVLSHTHVFSPQLVNIARFGYMRFDGISSVENPISTADIGTQSPVGSSDASIAAPGITIDGLFTIGDAGTPSQTQRTNSFIWQDAISLTKGRHSLRAGAEAKRHQVMINAPFSTTGLLDIRTFNDFLVGQSAVQNGSLDGISNVTMSGGSSGNFRKDERYTDLAGFVQDDYKVSDRLTLNVGLRYEIFSPPTEAHGRLVTFDPALAALAAPVPTFSGYVVTSNFSATVPDGVTQVHREGLWPTDYKNVSPRFGFALRVANRPTVVLRGGYGIYFDRLSAGLAESLVSQAPFSTQQLFSGTQNGGASLQAPFDPLLPSESSYPIFLPRVAGGGATIVGISTNVRSPYTQEYNLNTQLGFARDYLFELGYVGTRSLHVAGCTEFNQALLASPENPVYGETTNSAFNVLQRAPYQGAAPGSYSCDTAYDSNYNSLQSSLTKRFSHGLQFLGSYTWSRNLDQTSGSSGSQVFELWLLTNDQRNPRQSYGPTDFDRTHRGVLSLTYNLPKFANLPGVVRAVASGWQASGIMVLQSGTPITILDYNAGTVYGNYFFENRAELSGARITTSGSMFDRVMGQYLDPAGFTSAPEAPNGTNSGDTDFGNSGVGIARGPGQHNLDMAVEREIPLFEKNSLHFRTEFFNLTNTPNFSNPFNAVTFGPVFGKITSASNNPRIIQLALKYQF